MNGSAAYRRANAAQRAVQRLAATGWGSWLFADVLRRLDRPVYRLTHGRRTAAGVLSGLPVVLLSTVGARTGQLRTVPVLGFPTAGGLAVIASNFGREHHPSWYYNLRAHPDAQVTVDRHTWHVRATETQGVLRARIWREGLGLYPGWSAYERRTRSRMIAVFLLTSADEGSPRAHPLAGSPRPATA